MLKTVRFFCHTLYYILCINVCVCVFISYDCTYSDYFPAGINGLVFVTGTQILLAGRNGIFKLDFQERNALNV